MHLDRIAELLRAIDAEGFSEWRPKNYGAPSVPGCYFLGERQGDRIVPKRVGKASVLLSRLRNHVTSRPSLEIFSRFLVTTSAAEAREVEKRFLKNHSGALPWNRNK
jgi:hypothetical protein